MLVNLDLPVRCLDHLHDMERAHAPSRPLAEHDLRGFAEAALVIGKQAAHHASTRTLEGIPHHRSVP